MIFVTFLSTIGPIFANIVECNPNAAMDGGCHLLDHSSVWVTTKCVTGQTLTMEGTCIADCGVGFYLFGDVCLPCAATCNVCHGSEPFQCTVCDARYALNFQQICSFKCDVSAGVYGSPATGASCLACDTSCKTCTGGFQTSCVACPASTAGFAYSLLPMDYGLGRTNSGYCLRDPSVDYPNYYRKYPGDKVIRECPTGCLSCMDMFRCTSCVTGYNLYPTSATAAYALCYPNS